MSKWDDVYGAHLDPGIHIRRYEMNKNYYLWDNTDICTFLEEVEDLFSHGYGGNLKLRINDCSLTIAPHDGSCYYTPHGEITFNFSTVLI